MIRVIIALGLAFCLMAMALDAFGQTPAAGPTAPPPAVTVVAARQGKIIETTAVTGTLAAREEILVNPQIDQQAITEILADEGDHVEKGQVLARLQRDTLMANLAQYDAQIAHAEAAAAQARAQIAQMNATMTEANISLNRGKRLLSTGDTSRETVDQRQAANDVAAAQLQAAQGSLAAALADRALAAAQRQEIAVKLDRTDIRAPTAGIISRRSARLGAVVGMTGEPLFRLISNGTLELEANVPETVLARLRPGQTARIDVTGHDEPREGHVRLVAPEVSMATRLGRVRITLDSSDGLALGAFCRGRVEVARAQGVLVPTSAVLTKPGGAELQVVKGGVVETRQIHVGLRSDGMAQIASGLADGEQVVAISGTFVRNGDHVVAVSAQAGG